MRTVSRFTTALALLIPLAGASCSSEVQSFRGQPVPAALTVIQAATLAQAYLAQTAVPTTGLITDSERQPGGWWLRYQTAFDASVRPPSLSYIIRVRDDGAVDLMP